mmetsp:Transcript_10945/g.27623  ORF Transcript_10945/g.27623 Transcript_10945/m.27623 type:complete len:498 (-) Transcript_10945:1685-3178(-)
MRLLVRPCVHLRGEESSDKDDAERGLSVHVRREEEARGCQTQLPDQHHHLPEVPRALVAAVEIPELATEAEDVEAEAAFEEEEEDRAWDADAVHDAGEHARWREVAPDGVVPVARDGGVCAHHVQGGEALLVELRGEAGERLERLLHRREVEEGEEHEEGVDDRVGHHLPHLTRRRLHRTRAAAVDERRQRTAAHAAERLEAALVLCGSELLGLAEQPGKLALEPQAEARAREQCVVAVDGEQNGAQHTQEDERQRHHEDPLLGVADGGHHALGLRDVDADLEELEEAEEHLYVKRPLDLKAGEDGGRLEEVDRDGDRANVEARLGDGVHGYREEHQAHRQCDELQRARGAARALVGDVAVVARRAAVALARALRVGVPHLALHREVALVRVEHRVGLGVHQPPLAAEARGGGRARQVELGGPVARRLLRLHEVRPLLRGQRVVIRVERPRHDHVAEQDALVPVLEVAGRGVGHGVEERAAVALRAERARIARLAGE